MFTYNLFETPILTMLKIILILNSLRTNWFNLSAQCTLLTIYICTVFTFRGPCSQNKKAWVPFLNRFYLI